MKRCAMPILAVMLVFLFAEGVFAEKISHHGVTAEADGAARDCLTCHDGTVGHNVVFCKVKCDFKSPHSILRNYPPRGKEREYASTASIQAEGIKLENGKVTCISCHNLRDGGRNHLVKARRGGGICSICHIKK